MRATGDGGKEAGRRDGIRRSSLLAPRCPLLPRPCAAGFTILELMIAAVIALVIFGIGLMMITGASQAHSEAKARIRTNDKARMFFEQFERDLSGAYSGHYRRDALSQTLPLVAGVYACMTTTTEDFKAGSATEFQSVRYYVTKAANDRHLYRETEQNAPLGDTLNPTPDVLLCRDVESLETSFWILDGTSYTAATASTATHLLVKLTLLDPSEALGKPDSDPRKRIYQVYVPIPDGLLP